MHLNMEANIMIKMYLITFQRKKIINMNINILIKKMKLLKKKESTTMI